MIPSLILGGSIFFIVAGLICASLGAGRRDEYYRVVDENEALSALGWAGAAMGFIVLVGSLAMWPSLYFSSLNDVKNLEAFSESTLPAYLWTIEKAEGLSIDASTPGLIDIAYQEQAKAATQAIVDLRDKVDWYNSRLKGLRARKATPFGIFMYDIPDDLQPIRIREHTP